MNNAPVDILKQYWHFDIFRPGRKIICSVLAGNDTLALLPPAAENRCVTRSHIDERRFMPRDLATDRADERPGGTA